MTHIKVKFFRGILFVLTIFSSIFLCHTMCFSKILEETCQKGWVRVLVFDRCNPPGKPYTEKDAINNISYVKGYWKVQIDNYTRGSYDGPENVDYRGCPAGTYIIDNAEDVWEENCLNTQTYCPDHNKYLGEGCCRIGLMGPNKGNFGQDICKPPGNYYYTSVQTVSALFHWECIGNDDPLILSNNQGSQPETCPITYQN